VPVHPATPPGIYRVEVGMYDPATGQRLLAPGDQGQIWLEPLTVERPTSPAPVAALGMHHVAGTEFGELTLLGYDAYKLGWGHQPDAPLRPGDIVHVNLYWRAVTEPSGDWQVKITLVDADSNEWGKIVAEPAGAYPTNRWQAGDVWRGQFNLALPGDAPPGRYRVRVGPITPDGATLEPFLSDPLRVEQ
jgi:hypothetical protein